MFTLVVIRLKQQSGNVDFARWQAGHYKSCYCTSQKLIFNMNWS